MKFRLFASVLLAAFAFSAWPAAAADQVLAITGARVFDGSRFLPPSTVVVTGGKITAVGPKVAVPAGAKVVDGKGATLLPGLIDAHAHSFGDGLTRALQFGVTTELDMFADPTFARAMREAQAKGEADGRADLRSAGYMATAPGGHGTEYGFPIPTLTGPKEAQAWVDARVAEGSDYIKIVLDDGKTYGFTIPTLNRETVAALIEAAHRRGKMAVVHISTQADARFCLEAGVDGLVHLFLDSAPDPGFAKLAKAKKAFVVPTLAVIDGITGGTTGRALSKDPQVAPYLTALEVSGLERLFPNSAARKGLARNAPDAVRQLKAAGVPILAGTDAPNPGTAHGASLHQELELLVAAGLTPAEALQAATSAPARVFGLADRGRIAPGLRADLVLVAGDPGQEIRATRSLLHIWKGGHEVERKEAAAPAASVPATGGLVSNFEDGTLTAAMGAGWMDSTDAMMGGKSTVKKEVVSGDAAEGKGALQVSGATRAGFAYPWAGVLYSPGAQPMAPANLSKVAAVSFWAKGDGGTYQLLLFASRLGFRPAVSSFVAGPEWKQITVPLASFEGVGDGSDVTGIFWGGGPALGDFRFAIDDVRLVPRAP